jgi:O-antigen/teichoic acid export membrane protein
MGTAPVASLTGIDVPNAVPEQHVQGQSATPLRVSFSWTMLGNLTYAASQWGILVLLARLGSPEAVGQFSLGLAITAPVMLFAGLQLRSVQATDARRSFDFADYAGIRALTTIAAALTIFAISATLYRGETALAVAAFAVTKGVEALSDVVYGFWQQHERMDLMAQSLILRGVLSLMAATVCFVVFHSVWISVCGIAVAWAAVFITFDAPQAIRLGKTAGQPLTPRLSRPVMKRLLRLSLPLGVVTMLLSVNANIPRYLIGNVQGVRELGVFSALGYILLAGNTIVNALGQAATPRLAQYFAQGKTASFQGLSNRLVLIGMALGIAGVLVAAVAGQKVLGLIYGSEYAGYSGLFLWLMIAAACTYMASFAGYSLTAARHFKIQMPLFALIAALTFGLSAVMVRINGATGVAQAVAIASVVQLMATYGILRSKRVQSEIAEEL